MLMPRDNSNKTMCFTKNESSVIRKHNKSTEKWIKYGRITKIKSFVESFILVNKWDLYVVTGLFLNGHKGISGS